MAVCCAPGHDAPQLWRQLMAGQTAIRKVTRFATEAYGCDIGGWIQDLDGPDMLNQLLDRLLTQLKPVPADARLITATTKGDICALEQGRGFEPQQAASMLLATPLRHIHRRLELADAGVNVSAACASGTMALGRAYDLVALGRAEVVLVCCFDLLSEFVFSGFAGLRALTRQTCRPFDATRDGLALGEGAAALVLMHPGRAQREGLQPLGAVVGWGAATDAVHLTAPARDGRGLVHAIRLALARAGLKPAEIAAIVAHGTGTRYNDAMELTAFNTVFDTTALPVHSIKGAIGHTLGAAGGIEAVMGLYALREQCLPPTVGLVAPTPGGNVKVAATPLNISGSCILSTNSGFGGINAALVLSNRNL